MQAAQSHKRIPIRDDFPKIQDFYFLSNPSSEALMRLIKSELDKLGVSITDLKRVNIAYPHKKPGFESDHDKAVKKSSNNLRIELSRKYKHIQWVVVEGLYDDKILDRKNKQDVVSTLTALQRYVIDTGVQKEPCLFLEGALQKPEYFLLIDHVVDQGTTLANLYSYIEQNGGKVLAAISGGCYGSKFLQQTRGDNNRDCVFYSDALQDKIQDEGKVSALSWVFAKSAGEAYSEDQCLAAFNAALERHGNSAEALTNQEMISLIKHAGTPGFSFEGFLDELRAVPP